MSSTVEGTVSYGFFVGKFGLRVGLLWLSPCSYSIQFFGWRRDSLSADNFELFARGLGRSAEIPAFSQ